MTRLVAGSAPLYGRARLSLVVNAFDFRTAARFWGADHDPRLAATLYAIVGGTPAYIENVSGTPETLADLRDWVPRNLLNSTTMLFRQPRMLLSEDSTFSQIGMYGAVLTAIAEGSRTVSGIASRLGRSAADIQHYVRGLTGAGFLRHCPDAFRANRSEYQIADPLVRFHHAIVFPNWSRLEIYRPERAGSLWEQAQATFASQVAWPAFEAVCQTWTREFAGSGTLGGHAAEVMQGVINDRSARSARQLDVVVRDARRQVLAIGEAKWGEVMGMRHLARLERAADLLREQRRVDEGARLVLLLFSGAGFTGELSARASRSGGQIQLVGLDRLYSGS